MTLKLYLVHSESSFSMLAIVTLIYLFLFLNPFAPNTTNAILINSPEWYSYLPFEQFGRICLNSY